MAGVTLLTAGRRVVAGFCAGVDVAVVGFGVVVVVVVVGDAVVVDVEVVVVVVVGATDVVGNNSVVVSDAVCAAPVIAGALFCAGVSNVVAGSSSCTDWNVCRRMLSVVVVVVALTPTFDDGWRVM